MDSPFLRKLLLNTALLQRAWSLHLLEQQEQWQIPKSQYLKDHFAFMLVKREQQSERDSWIQLQGSQVFSLGAKGNVMFDHHIDF